MAREPPGQGRGLFRRPPRTDAPPSPPSPRAAAAGSTGPLTRAPAPTLPGSSGRSSAAPETSRRRPPFLPARPGSPTSRAGREGGGRAGEGTGPTLFAGGASPAGRRQPRTEVVSVHRRLSVRVTGSGSRRGRRGVSFRGRSRSPEPRVEAGRAGVWAEASGSAGRGRLALDAAETEPEPEPRPPRRRGLLRPPHELPRGLDWEAAATRDSRAQAGRSGRSGAAAQPTGRGRAPRKSRPGRRWAAEGGAETRVRARGGGAARQAQRPGPGHGAAPARRPAAREAAEAAAPSARRPPIEAAPGGACSPRGPRTRSSPAASPPPRPVRATSGRAPAAPPAPAAALDAGLRLGAGPGRPSRSRAWAPAARGGGPVRCQLGRSRTSRHGPMSGSQPTTTDRFPLKKPIRHGSILNRESPADKKQRVERSASHDFDPTDSSSKKTKSSSEESRSEIYGLVQRCVIIQKGDNGFGLTVSGDNPVFVQSVKEDGAAMRAGVQTGDRIIKVNGTLVTHSNHLEVVKLIKSGSYVALTVQGRPPGMPQIPLADSEGEPSVTGHMSPIMTSPHSPGASGNMERITSPVLMGEENNVVHNQKVEILRKMLQKEQERLQLLQEDYNRAPTPKLLKEIQEAKKLLPQLQEQLSKAPGPAQDGAVLTSSKPCSDTHVVSEVEADPGDGLGRVDCSSGDASWPSSDNAESPKSGLKERVYLEENMEKNEVIQDTDTQSLIGSPATRTAPHIIGAEDDDFGTEHEQINGQCSCFQSIELLKSRPAHLAVFLHHVVSQFDPATLLCYLYSDLYKQTNSKETRRIFLEFHQFFLDRSAHLKVSVPDEISVDLEKRRPELIPEDLHRHYIHTMQERVHPEIQRHLEDFRQKRSMGLTLAESELTRLDVERDKDRVTLEKERACAEQIVAKIEEVLMTAQAIEEDKSSTMQYVIFMYMKHLGVKVKEPRNLEHKRGRIGFLPKIKQSMKKEREGEEKGKRRGFSSILGPPRRPSRPDNSAIGRAMELQKPRHPKHSPPPPPVSPEPQDAAKSRQSGPASDGADAGCLPAGSVSSVASVATLSQDGGKENDMGSKPVAESPASADLGDAPPRAPSAALEFLPPPLDQVQEEEWEVERMTEHGTPKPFRKVDSIAFGESQSEDEQFDNDLETDPPSWQQLVSREVLLGLKPCEIKRQEVINELFYTERAHVRTLKVLDQVFYQRVCREGILSPSELRKIFSNLEDILQLHIGLNEQMKTVRKRNETSVIDQIGEDLLTWFSGPGEEKLKHAAATFCSNQPFALEMIKSRQKKDSRFQMFVQDAESNPLCRRLQLKDIIPTQMQRLTKYPLLLDNIAKYTEWPTEREKVKKAADHCRQILNYVNQAVKEAENKQHLEDYQRRLDTSNLKLSEYPDVEELRNLDLTKRKMIHEGPLVWKVNRDKTIDLYTLLLEDILVLLQKQDDRLVLRCHSKILASTADSKHTFSPVIKLNTVLVRQVATDNKAFFVISMSDNGAQIYELVAQTVSEKTVWQDLICRMAASVKEPSTKPIPLPQSPPCEGDNDDGEPPKLKAEPHGISVAGLQSPDRDLGLESPVLSSKPQSHPLGTSGKAEADELSVAERRFAQAQHAERAVKEAGVNDQITTPGPCVPVSEERWALDALRNLGLLKQLLAQKLSLAEKSTQEDWPHFSRCRTAFPGAQADSGTQNFEIMKSCPGQRQMPLRAGAGGLSTCSSPRASADSPAPRDPVVPALQEGQAGGVAVTGRTPVPLEAPPAEPEGGLDESGEHFFDAHEVHSDDTPSEGEGAVRQEEKDVNVHISGNYLILDGYEAVQESSTDEEGAAWLPPQPGTGLLAVDPAQQQRPSSQKALSDGAVSPFTPEPLAPQRWGALEGACFEIQSPSVCTDSQSQVLECIRTIEAALEHLKKVEESYTILCQRLAGSALTDKHSDKS